MTKRTVKRLLTALVLTLVVLGINHLEMASQAYQLDRVIVSEELFYALSGFCNTPEDLKQQGYSSIQEWKEQQLAPYRWFDFALIFLAALSILMCLLAGVYRKYFLLAFCSALMAGVFALCWYKTKNPLFIKFGIIGLLIFVYIQYCVQRENRET